MKIEIGNVLKRCLTSTETNGTGGGSGVSIGRTSALIADELIVRVLLAAGAGSVFYFW